jgi:hypothetical protein
MGPFDRTELAAMRDRGQLHRFHELSPDQVRWRPAAEFDDLFPPPEPPARLPANTSARAPAGPAAPEETAFRLRPARDNGEDDSPPPRRRSGIVDFIAILNFLYGALFLILGLMVASGVSLAIREFGVLRADPAALLAVVLLLLLSQAMVFLIAGFGVVARRRWGRIFALVLAGMSVLLTVVCAVAFFIYGAIFYACYAIFVCVFLLQRDYAAEFR